MISLFAAPAQISRSRSRSTILVEHGESCVFLYRAIGNAKLMICKVIP